MLFKKNCVFVYYLNLIRFEYNCDSMVYKSIYSLFFLEYEKLIIYILKES